MKLWVDDVRPAPDGWGWAKTYLQALDALRMNDIEILSLDHDLGDFEAVTERERTGYDILIWLATEAAHGNDHWPLEAIVIHSANPVGRERMQAVIDRYGHYGKP